MSNTSRFWKNKKKIICICALIAVVIIVTIIIVIVASSSNTVKYHEIDGILGNPLKGFAGWKSWPRGIQEKYPYSLAYYMLSLRHIMPEEDYIDYDHLEGVLNDALENGFQVVLRICLDFPNQEKSNTPEWVFNKVKTVNYEYEGQINKAVDWNDEKLLKIIENLQKKLGERYDGDPRLAFFQLGTYGHWGEFHETYVKKEERAKEESVDRVFYSLYNNFKKTQIQVRYAQARCINTSVGIFHDTYNSEHDYWMDRDLNETNLWDRYKTNCFGGKVDHNHRAIRFKDPNEVESFKNGIEKYHVSYLFDYDFYEKSEEYLKDNPQYIEIRNKIEYRMGYNYYLKTAEIKKSSDAVEIEFNIYNKGVAPFYEDWNINFGILRKHENDTLIVVKEIKSDQNISGVLEGQTKKISYKIEGITTKDYIVGFRVPSPIGSYVLFSNKEQKSKKEGGWFILKE